MSEAMYDRFGDLDDEFYEINDRLEILVMRYLLDHADYFRPRQSAEGSSD